MDRKTDGQKKRWTQIDRHKQIDTNRRNNKQMNRQKRDIRTD